MSNKRKEGMAQWKTRKKYNRLRTAKDRKPSTKEEMDTQDAEDTKCTTSPGNY